MWKFKPTLLVSEKVLVFLRFGAVRIFDQSSKFPIRSDGTREFAPISCSMHFHVVFHQKRHLSCCRIVPFLPINDGRNSTFKRGYFVITRSGVILNDHLAVSGNDVAVVAKNTVALCSRTRLVPITTTFSANVKMWRGVNMYFSNVT